MKRYKIIFIIIIALCLVFPAILFSQVDTAWVRRYNGPTNSSDYAYAIAVDGAGNVYVTGNSAGSGTGLDYATIKYNSAGDIQWVRGYNGPGNNDDCANGIVVDNSGNIYVTGYSRGTSNNDYLTIKYGPTGNTLWERRYNGPGDGTDYAQAIAVDNSSNIYVTGYSFGLGTSWDYATIKYSSVGNELWVSRYDRAAGTDRAYAIAVDGLGNVCVTGASYSGTNRDYTTIKYNSDGVEQWLRIYDGGSGDDYPEAITVDGLGNVYITGHSNGSGTYRDYTTIKYNSVGDTQWVRRYNGGGYDDASAIAVDGSGNVYVTGRSAISGSSYDYATIKYNSAGDTQWVRRYDTGSGDDAYAIALDNSGNIYVTGKIHGGISRDYATIKYNSAGVQEWVITYNGTGNSADEAYAIAVDGSGNVYVTGESYGTTFDYATIKYVQAPGIEENRSPLSANRLLLEVYPNPASSFFVIRGPSFVKNIKIFDISGKIVKEILPLRFTQGQNDNTVRVPLNGIKNGIYFIQVGDEMVKEKLVVIK